MSKLDIQKVLKELAKEIEELKQANEKQNVLLEQLKKAAAK